VLAVLWWVWASYAWLTNAPDADAGIVTATLLFATPASLITLAAVAVPALAALALVGGIRLALHAYELIHWREERAERRSADGPAQTIETRQVT
jgi:hypothetical protein